MKEVEAYEAKTGLAQLLDEVEPARATRTGTAARETIDQLRSFRKGRKLGRLSLKMMIREGRR